MDSAYELYKQFQNLRNIFKEEGYEPWTSCEFDFTKEGELKVSFDYIDWINTEFDQIGPSKLLYVQKIWGYTRNGI